VQRAERVPTQLLDGRNVAASDKTRSAPYPARLRQGGHSETEAIQREKWKGQRTRRRIFLTLTSPSSFRFAATRWAGSLTCDEKRCDSSEPAPFSLTAFGVNGPTLRFFVVGPLTHREAGRSGATNNVG
jgi:hypothetical protein